MKILAAFLLSGTAFAEPIILPVTEDASVIKTSYAIANAADTAFGLQSEVAVGSYHLVAEGLVKLSLTSIQNVSYQKAELVIASPRVVGSFPAPFAVAQVSPDWSEATVTWNTKPDRIQDLGVVSIGVEEAVIDVTEALNRSLCDGATALALSFASTGSANLFFAAHEAESDQAAVYLRLIPSAEDDADGLAL